MKKYIIKLIVALFLLAGFSGAGWYLWQTDSTIDAPIRIGINPWMGYEFLYLAEQKGFLAEEGLNVKLLQYSSLEDVRAAFERGHIDGITSTVVEVIQANVSGNRIAQVVLVADFSNGADVILAKQPFSSMKQLKGKKIGVEKASLGMFMLARALNKAGMSLKDVQALAYDQPAMPQAFDKGIVDAVVTYPPYSIKIASHGAVNTIFDSSVIPGEILDTISFDSALLQRKPEIVPAFIRAWDKALAYAESHPQEAYAIMAQRENISPEEFEAGLEEIHVVPVNEQETLMEPNGKLEQAILLMSAILHGSGELAQPVTEPERYIFRAGKEK